MAAGVPTYLCEIEFVAGSGTWVDVTTYCTPTGFKVTRGRPSAFDDTAAGTLSFVLQNTDGRFTPDNALSPYSPNVVEGRRVRLTVTKGASSSKRFFGRITSWAPSFGDGEPNASVVEVNATNVFGGLMLRKVLSAAAERAVIGGQSEVFPFQESARVPTVFSAYRTSGIVSNKMRVLQPQSGKGSIATGEIDGAGVLGNGMVSITTEDGIGPVLIMQRGTGYIPTNYYFPFRTSVDIKSGDPDVWLMDVQAIAIGTALRDWGPAWRVWSLRAHVNGNRTQLLLYDNNDVLLATLLTSLPSSQWFVLRWVSNNLELYSLPGPRLRATYVGLGSPPDSVVFGGRLNAGKADLCAPIELGGVYISSSTVNYLDPLGTIPTQTRVSDVALAAGMTVTISGADNRSIALDTGGVAGEVLGKVARTVGATVDADYANVNADKAFKWLGPDTQREQAVALTIDVEADLDASNALPFSRGNEGTPTRCDVTWPGGTVTLIGDETYQRIDASVDTLAATDADANIVAAAVITQPRSLRLTGASVDLVHATNDLYASAFALAIGSRVRVTGLPSTLFGKTYVDGYVQGWTETYTPDSAAWELDTEPADSPTEGEFDASGDTGLGRFSAGGAFTVTGGTAVGTTATGTIVVTTSVSGLFFTTDATCYPIDLDWNGERVTVTAAPAAGAGSTQTLTLTARGVAPSVARTHASGETVDVWHAPNFAY